jgi:hypothetical protein
MLADGTEAASRAMSNPTPGRLKGLVQTMINKAFTDGQLDECDLTLKDLNAISEAFTRILTGIYHHRPEYPEDKKDEQKTSEKPEDSGAKDQPDRKPAEKREESKQSTPEAQQKPEKSEAHEPEPDARKPANEEVPLADRSSDVWDITEEQVEDLRRERREHASTNSEQSSDDDPNDDQASGDDDSRDDASSVSRIGTS